MIIPMRIRALRVILLLAAAATLGAPATAQEGHPLAGTWYGEFSTGNQPRDLTVVMKWDGKTASGLINPGADAVQLSSVVLDITPGKPAAEGRDSTTGTPPVFHVRFQANMPGGATTFEGTIQNPVAGNRRITGTWTRGSEKGPFQLRRL
jgi:hypothetical protein